MLHPIITFQNINMWMDNKGKDIILYISIFGIHYRLNDLPPNNTMTPEP